MYTFVYSLGKLFSAFDPFLVIQEQWAAVKQNVSNVFYSKKHDIYHQIFV